MKELCIYLLVYVGIQLRRNEKKLLNDINADKDGRLRFHILDDKGKRKKRIQTREEKIFVLANDCLTGDPSVHDLSLTQVSLLITFNVFLHNLDPCCIWLYSELDCWNQIGFCVIGYELYMFKWL